jgi:hypothetical protein
MESENTEFGDRALSPACLMAALLEHVGECLQHNTSAAVEGILCERLRRPPLLSCTWV